MITDQLISDIVVAGTRRYYSVTNAHGKRWLLPARNMRTAMGVYQPGSRNGHLLKNWFPVLHRVPGVRQMLHAGVGYSALRRDIQEVIAKAFGVDDFEWALFGGTPCVHQKITIQVFAGRHLLGYVKLSYSSEIGQLFEHEREALSRVKDLNVPRTLHCGKVGDIYMFIQTTSKTLQSKEIHEWTTHHQEFIERLFELTRHETLFDQSDYAVVLDSIDPYLPLLPQHQAEIITKAREEVVAKYMGKEVEYGVYQGDFTPWNMVLNPDGLFVFDWEYSRLSYPPLLDKWHYLVQTAIFERVLSHEEIINMMEPYFGEESLKLYLLDVICHFTVREKGQFPHCMGQSQELWCKLLSRCTAK